MKKTWVRMRTGTSSWKITTIFQSHSPKASAFSLQAKLIPTDRNKSAHHSM